MRALTRPELVRLAFWSKNMLVVRESNFSWPGFSYDKSEWRRMKLLAKAVSGAAYLKFIWLNAFIFVLFAAAAVVGVLLPALLLLYPDPRNLHPLPFTLLLAATTFVAIGFGLPLSMRISAWLCASETMRKKLSQTAADARLANRVSWQLMRMTLILCGMLVPGILLAIAFEIDGGPVLTALKFAAAAIILGAVTMTALRRPA
jgi:hypothetical protein